MGDKITALMTSVFGVSWKTSFFSFLSACVAYFTLTGVKIPETAQEWKGAIFSMLLYAWGSSSKDGNVSNAAVPVAPVKVPIEVSQPSSGL